MGRYRLLAFSSLLALTLITAIPGNGQAPASKASPHSGKAAASADPPLIDLAGYQQLLAKHRGKPLVVNFWATWCEPCQSEIPVLISLQQEYSSKGFTMLGASMDDDPSKVVPQFVKSKEFKVDGKDETMNYPLVEGSDAITDKFGGLLGMPTSFLISRDGKIVKRYIGVVNPAQITKDIESQL